MILLCCKWHINQNGTFYYHILYLLLSNCRHQSWRACVLQRYGHYVCLLVYLHVVDFLYSHTCFAKSCIQYLDWKDTHRSILNSKLGSNNITQRQRTLLWNPVNPVIHMVGKRQRRTKDLLGTECQQILLQLQNLMAPVLFLCKCTELLGIFHFFGTIACPNPCIEIASLLE